MSRTRENLIGFQTIVMREVTRVMRIWVQTIVPPAITMTLYFIIFGNLIGSQIGSMDGFSYMQYIAPGLIMMAIITNSYSNVVSSFFSSKFQRHIEEMLVSPMPHSLILLGHVAGAWQRARAALDGEYELVCAFEDRIDTTMLIIASIVFVAVVLFLGCLYTSRTDF